MSQPPSYLEIEKQLQSIDTMADNNNRTGLNIHIDAKSVLYSFSMIVTVYAFVTGIVLRARESEKIQLSDSLANDLQAIL